MCWNPSINMSKVVAIVSSPRAKGQGNAIVEKMAEVAKANGNEVEVIYINKIDNLKGCQACMGCKKNPGKCVRNDSLTPVLDSVAAADSLILTTPDYFSQACGQYRMFEDRLYGFVGPDYQPTITPKKVAIVVTCGGGIDGAHAIANAMQGVMTNFMKCDVVGQLVYSEKDSGNFAENADAIAKAEEIANKL